jgi:beta-galactosidase
VGDPLLEYSTAQLLCKLDDPSTYVFFAWPGISPEFSLVPPAGSSVEAPHARITKENGHVYVDAIEPGTAAAIQIHGPGGRSTQIVVLTRDQALNTWKAGVGGREHLFLSAAELSFEKDRIHIFSKEPSRLTLDTFPKFEHSFADFSTTGEDGVFTSYAAHVTPVSAAADVQKLSDAGPAAPMKMGKEVAMAPTDPDFQNAARWLIHVPHVVNPGVNSIFLRIDYQGDVARLYAGDRLITDSFYNGAPWEIGLSSLTPEELAHGLELKILPLRKDAPIYLPAGVRAALPKSSDVLNLKDVRIVPEYESVMDLSR